jgi:hypothetical protein
MIEKERLEKIEVLMITEKNLSRKSQNLLLEQFAIMNGKMR